MSRSVRTASRFAPRRRFAFLLVAALALPSGGCAALFGGMETAPNGLSVSDDALRRQLARGEYVDAWSALAASDAEVLPTDELLASMYRGVVAYYAGSWDSSLVHLDHAEALAQDRVTTSLSRSALSTLTNDRILPYEPGTSERLLVHYYGVLAGTRAGESDVAAVEARRLSHLLAQYDEQADSSEADARRLRALMHYLSGVAFERAGERADAEVSYRRAAALSTALAEPEPLGHADSGDVVVVLERGFVSHLAQETIWVLLLPDEVETLTSGELGEKLAVAGIVALQVVAELSARRDGRSIVYDDRHSRRRVYYSEHHDYDHDDDDSDQLPWLLEIAWPVLRDDWQSGGTPHVAVGAAASADGARSLAEYRADVSAAYARDIATERAAVLGRTVVRAASRFALTKAAEKKADEEADGLGGLVGVLGNLGSVLLERADTRSLHLLPGEIGVTRLRLPAGEHELWVVEQPAAGNPRRFPLGTVVVQPGAVVVTTTRLWR